MRRFELFFLVLAACGNRAEPASPAPATSEAPAPEPVATEAPATEPPPVVRRKPFELRSTCAEVTRVVIGDDPKGEGRTLAPFSSVDVPRSASGQDTVWLLDDKGEPLVKVTVTRGMKRVEIGRSCRTLDAR